MLRYDITLWARNNSVDVTYSQAPKLPTDSLRTEFELLRTLRFFELRARTECRALARLAVDDF